LVSSPTSHRNLTQIEYVVLDEADRMLDMGFEKEVRAILEATPKSRQTLLYSATWPQEIRELAREFLNDRPIKVNIGSDDLEANGRVSQEVEVVSDPRSRDGKMVNLLKKYTSDPKWKGKGKEVRILVFVLYKKEATRVETTLKRAGWRACGIHGDKSQEARTAALADFKSGKVPILVATDVAARGLDIPNVEYVINYSFPLTIEDYIHRIGRTGRAGKHGVSYTFFHQGDKARSGELVNVLRQAKMPVPANLMKFGCTVKKKEHKLYGAFHKDVDMSKKGKRITFD
jgi:ATP-dependent RNA helicase DBP3